MPTFPKKQFPEVKHRPISPVFQEGRAPRGAFGIEGVQELGQGLAKVGDAFATIAIDEQKDENDRLAKEQDVSYDEDKLFLLYGDGTDENPGLYGLRAAAAVEQAPHTRQAIRKLFRERLGKIKNSRVARMFEASAADKDRNDLRSIAAFITRERKGAQIEAASARSATATNRAARNPADRALTKKSLSTVEAETMTQARLEGILNRPGLVEARLRAARTVHFDAIIRAARPHSPQLAEELLKEYSAQMDTGVVSKLKESLKTPVLTIQGQEAMVDILALQERKGWTRKETKAHIKGTYEGDLEEWLLDKYNKDLTQAKADAEARAGALRTEAHRYLKDHTLDELVTNRSDLYDALLESPDGRREIDSLVALDKLNAKRQEFADRDVNAVIHRLSRIIGKVARSKIPIHQMKHLMTATTWKIWEGRVNRAIEQLGGDAEGTALWGRVITEARRHRMWKALKIGAEDQGEKQQEIATQHLIELEEWVASKKGQTVETGDIIDKIADQWSKVVTEGPAGSAALMLGIADNIVEAKATWSPNDIANSRMELDLVNPVQEANARAAFEKNGIPNPTEDQLEQYLAAHGFNDIPRMNRLLGRGPVTPSPLRRVQEPPQPAPVTRPATPAGPPAPTTPTAPDTGRTLEGEAALQALIAAEDALPEDDPTKALLNNLREMLEAPPEPEKIGEDTGVPEIERITQEATDIAEEILGARRGVTEEQRAIEIDRQIDRLTREAAKEKAAESKRIIRQKQLEEENVRLMEEEETPEDADLRRRGEEALREFDESRAKLKARREKHQAFERSKKQVSKEKPVAKTKSEAGVFDAEGSGFDEATAEEFGLARDDTGHLGSVVPTTKEQQEELELPADSFMVLKGSKHPTFDKAVAAEEARGFKVKKVGDRFFSIPEEIEDEGPAEEITKPEPKVDKDVVAALAEIESGGEKDPENAKSPAGALGKFQIMPATAAQPGFGVKPLSTGKDVLAASIAEQERFMIDYLSALTERLGSLELALMAYNWGYGNVRKFLAGEKKPPKETRDYIMKFKRAGIL